MFPADIICTIIIRCPNLYPMYLNTVLPAAAEPEIIPWKIILLPMGINMPMGNTMAMQVRGCTNQYLMCADYFVPKWALPWILWKKVVNLNWVPNTRYLNLYLMYPNTVRPN